MNLKHPRRIAAASLLCLCSLGTLSACASNEPTLPKWPEAENIANSSLPLGSVLLTNPTYVPDVATQEPAFGSLAPDALTPQERIPEIVARGRVIVGVAQSLNRLGFRDPVTGDLAGFEVDLGREIARDIFGDPNRVDFRFVESKDRTEALQEGRVDIIIRTMSITRERQRDLEFSTPYLEVHNRLLVREGSPITSFADLANRRVCVSASSTSAAAVTRFPVKEVLETQTWTDCLFAMQRNQADAIFTDDAILTGLQAQDPYTRMIDEEFGTDYYGVAMAAPTADKDTRGLVRQVNATMERIRQDGTWDQLYNFWLRDFLAPGQSLPMQYRTPDEDAQLEEFRRSSAGAGAGAGSGAAADAGAGAGSSTASTPTDAATATSPTAIDEEVQP